MLASAVGVAAYTFASWRSAGRSEVRCPDVVCGPCSLQCPAVSCHPAGAPGFWIGLVLGGALGVAAGLWCAWLRERPEVSSPAAFSPQPAAQVLDLQVPTNGSRRAAAHAVRA